MTTTVLKHSIRHLAAIAQDAINECKSSWGPIRPFPTLDATAWKLFSDIKALMTFKDRGLSITDKLLGELLNAIEPCFAEREALEKALLSSVTIKNILVHAGNDPDSLHPWPQDAGPKPSILVSWAIYVGANTMLNPRLNSDAQLRLYFQHSFAFLITTASQAVRNVIIPEIPHIPSAIESQQPIKRTPEKTLPKNPSSSSPSTPIRAGRYNDVLNTTQLPIMLPPLRFTFDTSIKLAPALASPKTFESRLGAFACLIRKIPPPESVFPLSPLGSQPSLASIAAPFASTLPVNFKSTRTRSRSRPRPRTTKPSFGRPRHLSPPSRLPLGRSHWIDFRRPNSLVRSWPPRNQPIKATPPAKRQRVLEPAPPSRPATTTETAEAAVLPQPCKQGELTGASTIPAAFDSRVVSGESGLNFDYVHQTSAAAKRSWIEAMLAS
ncbi:hypothetical protein MIND_00991400 [Mycena indigotica]|uniref:Uncharacterized protein n=1 Tax=Mycena indigotica TaxID=2126181 RepID=A0A8H6W056_9AGAR|nr:uncharacterized protein MIND_00991400 [Mycena indigotica]KAF7294549.1 hypothetical protein MIND_00991400 [Mycena indigotica]